MESWKGSIITTKEIIENFLPQDLRNARNKISFFIRSGWHFSSFGGSERVIKKFESFAHLEYNTDVLKDPEHIKKCLETGSDLFKRNIKIAKSQKVDKNFFPKDLLELMNKDQNFYFGK